MRVILTKSQVQEIVTVQTKNVVFIDVQKSGDKIPGSITLDMKSDMTGENTFLPDPEKLAEKLGKIGITNKDTLIIYDEGSNRGASKAWFVFHYLGHDAVYILQGGRNAWDEPAISPATREPKNYILNVRESAVADINKIKVEMNKNKSVLIDSRFKHRYHGEVEPTDARAGHIPGAENYQVKEAFTETGEFKSQAVLAKHFANLGSKSEVIVSCGSGNSACMNLVAMKEAGLKNVTLYPGGFSEWVADENNEIEKD